MTKKVVGIDLGGTEVKMGIFTSDGDLLKSWAIKTNTENKGSNIIPEIAASIKETLVEEGIDPTDILAAGIGVPGPVLNKTTVNGCVNLGWGVMDVSSILSAELGGIPVVVDNDANTAALGEIWRGNASDYNSIVFLTLGTDVGGGIIVNKKTISGTFGGGGEVGHMKVNPLETEAHVCGGYGCLGQYASATGLVRLAKKHLAQSDKASTLREVSILEVTAKHVTDAAKEGDMLAVEIMEEYADIFGRAIAMMSCVVEPEAFLFGGGVSKAGDYLLDLVSASFKKYCFHTALNTQFRLATLGNSAGIYGAAFMALS